MESDYLIDLDLDVINALKKIDIYKDAILYFRMEGKKLSVSFTGTPENLINAFVELMNRYKGLYDILSTATVMYEEDSFCILEEE